MEVIKKTKKIKKRRRRSKDNKAEEPITDIQNLYNENDTVQESEIRNIKNTINVKKDQLVQTEITNDICAELDEKNEQVKSLTDRLQQITSKLYESKNAYTTLKQDFNKAQKLLCSEIGENVTVASISNQAGWRGRAELIQQLQQRISELLQKLSENDTSRRKSLERRSASSVRLFDREKKQQIENLTKELRDSEATLESTKKKLDAAKARKAVLENDLNSARKTIALLNEKTTHDNQLIDALHDQLQALESKFQDREVTVKKQSDKYEREIVLLKSELEAAHLHLKNFKRQIEQKEKEVESIKSRNDITGDRKIPHHEQTNGLRESPIQSPRNYTKDANEYIAISIAAEAERERLLELVTVLNRRLDKERNENEQLSESFKKERSKTAKLETKLQKLELERVGLSRVNSGSYRLKAPRLPVVQSSELGDPEEMRLKYELLQEECLTLKTRLATMQSEKSTDLAAFKKMLEQTRKIFKDAYRGKVPTIGCNSSITI